jgi:hypothetical protein
MRIIVCRIQIAHSKSVFLPMPQCVAAPQLQRVHNNLQTPVFDEASVPHQGMCGPAGPSQEFDRRTAAAPGKADNSNHEHRSSCCPPKPMQPSARISADPVLAPFTAFHPILGNFRAPQPFPPISVPCSLHHTQQVTSVPSGSALITSGALQRTLTRTACCGVLSTCCRWHQSKTIIAACASCPTTHCSLG